MADLQPSEIRIGDTEREGALTALGEHMGAGRLDIDEYAERSAKVATAKTRGELLALFTDLPAPHPTFGAAKAPTPVAPVSSSAPVPRSGGSAVPFGQRIMAAAVPLAGIAAVVLFFSLHTWLFFLLPAAVMLVGGAVWGDEWKHQKRMSRERYRQERRDFRRRNRGW
ncbi:MAG TPA: DUF1707 domain-containing protein [Pseudonocardiaceae bacterium]|nr:DUF1707 domain-containing protein [Pseudonocardiaceae bacterium]